MAENSDESKKETGTKEAKSESQYAALLCEVCGKIDE